MDIIFQFTIQTPHWLNITYTYIHIAYTYTHVHTYRTAQTNSYYKEASAKNPGEVQTYDHFTVAML